MANLGSLAVLVVIAATWIGLAAGTVFHLSQMGAAIDALKTAPAQHRSSPVATLNSAQ
jgi:hypothetical protein